jgi:hypothetical protein
MGADPPIRQVNEARRSRRLLALGAVGAASAGLPRNLTPPKLYGEFVARRWPSTPATGRGADLPVLLGALARPTAASASRRPTSARSMRPPCGLITAGGPPVLQAKGGIERVGMLLQPYFRWGGSPRSVRYAWQRCTPARCVDIRHHGPGLARPRRRRRHVAAHRLDRVGGRGCARALADDDSVR